jgi:transcriptional regulator with GAF, ATPase, and Fis domain
MMTVKFGLADNDTLQLDGIALTGSDQQRLLAVIQSANLVERVDVHR